MIKVFGAFSCFCLFYIGLCVFFFFFKEQSSSYFKRQKAAGLSMRKYHWQVIWYVCLKIDQAVYLLDNRKLFFNPVLDSAPAVTPTPVLASLLGDTAHLSKPTDLQTAGRVRNTEQAVRVLIWGTQDRLGPKKKVASKHSIFSSGHTTLFMHNFYSVCSLEGFSPQKKQSSYSVL